jgi:type I restriction enzyme, S subunit
MRYILDEISERKGEYGGGFSAVEYFPTAPRYVRITDINDDGKLNSDIKAPSGTPQEWEKYLLKDGDILFARSGATVGKTFLYTQDAGHCIYAGYLIRFRPRKDIADSKYIYYYTKTSQYQSWVGNKQNVVAQPNINAKQYGRELEIPLPPLEDQKRIAAILDAADALRQKDSTLIAKYEELTQSLFMDMFGDPVTNPKGWKSESLEHLADIASGVTKGRKLKDERLIDIPYMRVANVQDGYLDLSEIKTIPGTELDISKYQLESGDVLLTEGGDPDKLGRGAVWNNEIPNCIHQNHIFRVRVDFSKVHPLYLSKLTGSTYGKNYFLRSSKQTTGIASINKTQLKSFPVLLPPTGLQNRFAEHIEQIEKQKQLAQQSLQKSEELFNSLLQRAFKGELTDTNSSPPLTRSHAELVSASVTD